MASEEKCQSYQNDVKRLADAKDRSPCSVWTEADAVKCATQLGLVFGMTLQVAQLVHAMSELAFITVLAFASFLKWTTQFRLVAEEGQKKEFQTSDRSWLQFTTHRDVFV